MTSAWAIQNSEVEQTAPRIGVYRGNLPANVGADVAPKPTDGCVRLVTVPGKTIAKLRFSGSTDVSRARLWELIGILISLAPKGSTLSARL